MNNSKYKYDTSVIVAVYNNFHWLRLILDALRMQSRGDFEVVIADDGSSPETVSSIRQYISESKDMPVIHSWQPDEGWRKNKCLNEAIRRSRGEYLVLMIHRHHSRLFMGAQDNAELFRAAKDNHVTFVSTGLYPPSDSDSIN